MINLYIVQDKNTMTNTKTALLMSEPPSDFQIKNIILRISKKRNSEYKIEPIYIQGILRLNNKL